MIFSESLTKFVRTYEYIAQLVGFGDPALEAFASYARLLRKRLKGAFGKDITDTDQVTFTVHVSEKLRGGCGGNLGLPGGSSCIHTKTASERSSST